MEALEYFTCISYDNVDFLIQNKYIRSGIYLQTQKDSKTIIFNKETLPHIYIGDIVEKEFDCKADGEYGVVLVLNVADFATDVSARISDYTDTAFPASGNLALSLNGSINSKLVDITTLRILPQSINHRMTECGISAIGFPADSNKQILISPENLMRKFFTGGLL